MGWTVFQVKALWLERTGCIWGTEGRKCMVRSKRNMSWYKFANEVRYLEAKKNLIKAFERFGEQMA